MDDCKDEYSRWLIVVVLWWVADCVDDNGGWMTLKHCQWMILACYLVICGE